jgi:hypothetical protein
MNEKVEKLGNYEFEKEYSIYKNHDTELVDKIKSMPETDSFFLWNRGGKFKVDKVLNDTQTMCINVREGGEDEGGVQYEVIDSKEIPEMLREAHLVNINKTYPVYDHFINNFGEIDTNRGKIIEVSKDLMTQFNRESEYQDVSVRSHTWSVSTWRGYTYEESKEGYSNGFIFFDKEGNYVVRDYNQNLLECAKSKPRSRDETIERFLSQFDKYESFEHAEGSNKWFTEEWCLHFHEQEDKDWGLKLEVEKVERRNQHTQVYFNQGDSYRKVTKPKKGLKTVGPEHIKEYLRKLIAEYK